MPCFTQDVQIYVRSCWLLRYATQTSYIQAQSETTTALVSAAKGRGSTAEKPWAPWADSEGPGRGSHACGQPEHVSAALGAWTQARRE